jgi:hypothetical protein
VRQHLADLAVEIALQLLAADHRGADGSGWAVLLDPAGNEFCVTRAEDERHP